MAIEQEENGRKFDKAVSELETVRNKMVSLKDECHTLNSNLSTLNENFKNRITQLQVASMIDITPRAREYIQQQALAISKQACDDLEARSKKIVARMTRQADRVVMPTSACYVMCISLVVLLAGFTILVMLNEYRLHNHLITQLIWIIGALLVFTNAMTIATFIWLHHRE